MTFIELIVYDPRINDIKRYITYYTAPLITEIIADLIYLGVVNYFSVYSSLFPSTSFLNHQMFL